MHGTFNNDPRRNNKNYNYTVSHAPYKGVRLRRNLPSLITCYGAQKLERGGTLVSFPSGEVLQTTRLVITQTSKKNPKLKTVFHVLKDKNKQRHWLAVEETVPNGPRYETKEFYKLREYRGHELGERNAMIKQSFELNIAALHHPAVIDDYGLEPLVRKDDTLKGQRVITNAGAKEWVLGKFDDQPVPENTIMTHTGIRLGMHVRGYSALYTDYAILRDGKNRERLIFMSNNSRVALPFRPLSKTTTVRYGPDGQVKIG